MLEIMRKSVPPSPAQQHGQQQRAEHHQFTAADLKLHCAISDPGAGQRRRMATSSVNGVNGKNFVDINQIAAARD